MIRSLLYLALEWKNEAKIRHSSMVKEGGFCFFSISIFGENLLMNFACFPSDEPCHLDRARAGKKAQTYLPICMNSSSFSLLFTFSLSAGVFGRIPRSRFSYRQKRNIWCGEGEIFGISSFGKTLVVMRAYVVAHGPPTMTVVGMIKFYLLSIQKGFSKFVCSSWEMNPYPFAGGNLGLRGNIKKSPQKSWWADHKLQTATICTRIATFIFRTRLCPWFHFHHTHHITTT